MVYMYKQSALTPETYLTNKRYFDTSLVSLLEKQQHQIQSLQKKAKLRDATVYKKTAILTTLRVKYKDLSAVHYNLKQLLKETKDGADKIIKDMDKEIRNINKRIDDELQQSYTENNELYDENQALKKEIEKLRRERDKYKKVASQDSTNSSLCPSSDMFKKQVGLRQPSTKKVGGQVGHIGHHSKLTQEPHTIIEKTVRVAPTGATAVFNDANEIVYYVTQEIDAKFVTTITETRYFIQEDGEIIPSEVMKTYKINNVTYHTSFKSMVLYLNSKGTIALHRLCTILNELSKGETHLRASTVTNWSKEFYDKSESARKSIIKEIQESRVTCVDETGWKIAGKNNWMQIMCTDHVVYFVCTKKRADDITGPIKLLEGYKGHLVHDHFKSYYRLENCTHNQCNVHILRYLRAGIDFYGSVECAQLMQLMIEMNHTKKELLAKGILQMEDAKKREYEDRYLEIIDKTICSYNEKNPTMPKKYVPDYIKTMKRMREYKEDHLRFIEDFSVPFDNNTAERQARSVKAKKKISGQSNNLRTANYFAAIQTFNQTCILQNRNTLETIEDILKW